MSNYRRGSRAEHRALSDLINQGYQGLRAAGSRGSGSQKGLIDLIVWNAEHVRFIQVKHISRKRSFKALQAELAQMPHPPGSTVELWVWLKSHGWYIQRICA